MKVRHIVVYICLLSLTACVSIDSRSWSEIVDSEASKSISGKFKNSAKYISTGQFVAVGNIAELLGGWSKDSEYASIKMMADGLVVRFSNSTESIKYKTDKIVIEEDGKIQLPSTGECGVSDGLIGCDKHKIKLFININGDLVSIQSGGGSGLFGPFPIGVYARQIAIFESVQ